MIFLNNIDIFIKIEGTKLSIKKTPDIAKAEGNIFAKDNPAGWNIRLTARASNTRKNNNPQKKLPILMIREANNIGIKDISHRNPAIRRTGKYIKLKRSLKICPFLLNKMIMCKHTK